MAQMYHYHVNFSSLLARPCWSMLPKEEDEKNKNFNHIKFDYKLNLISSHTPSVLYLPIC